MNNKIKYDDESELWVKKIVKEWVDDRGMVRRQVRWFRVNGNLNLGSIAKPKNTDILTYEWRDKAVSQRLMGRFFGGE